MLTNNIIFYTNISLPIDVYMDKLNQFFLSNSKLETSLYIIKYKNIKGIFNFMPKIVTSIRYDNNSNKTVVEKYDDYFGYETPLYMINIKYFYYQSISTILTTKDLLNIEYIKLISTNFDIKNNENNSLYFNNRILFIKDIMDKPIDFNKRNIICFNLKNNAEYYLFLDKFSNIKLDTINNSLRIECLYYTHSNQHTEIGYLGGHRFSYIEKEIGLISKIRLLNPKEKYDLFFNAVEKKIPNKEIYEDIKKYFIPI